MAKNRGTLSNAGVFMSFLAFSFLSFTIISPIVSSNADTNNASIEAGPYIASISADQSTDINITPTNTQTVYTGTNTITYTNTCPYGFNVTMSSNADNTSLVRLGDDTAIKEIPSTTTTALTDNTWGVSVDGGSTYKPVPAIGSPTNIINTFEATTNPVALDLIYGVKTNNELPSGSYVRDVVYTISAKPQCLTYGVTWDFDDGTAKSGATYPETMNFSQTIDLSGLTPTKEGYEFTGWSNGTDTYTGTETAADINPGIYTEITMTAQWERIITMQEFSCSTLSVGDTVKLRDARDNNEYTVRKLADRKCWMTDNLRLINKTISSADSDLLEGETWTVPTSSKSGFGTQQNRNKAYLDSTYGGYYTYYAATAGTGGSSATSGNASSSICPKGWKLPTGDINGEFETLYSYYNSSALMRGEPGFTLSGRLVASTGDIDEQGESGWFWSSTVSNALNADILTVYDNSGVQPTNVHTKFDGLTIRCVASTEKMQGFDSSTLSANESKDLEDIRDNKIYTVKKLADGRVWMTENLRLIDKTISSTDSNLPSGATWTVPTSSTSGFNAYNTNNAYLDSTHGGHYTFYAATAGWGTNSITSGNSPKDICPKGWRLPTGGDGGELQNLYNKYNSSALMRGDPGFVLSGRVYDGSASDQGSSGRYWSSTVDDANYSYGLYLSDSSVGSVLSNNKFYGFSIRCVTYESMQEYDVSKLVNTGDSTTLIDKRDGNLYTVKRLADGNVWMTENLRLIDKKISSADSNLPSGETWTVPVSSTSGFGELNTNNAYFDSSYGGYYTFYTATAGWGTDSVESGNAPKDICPKGWRLPTGGASGEFQVLYSNYNSSALLQGVPGIVLSGYVRNSSVYSQGSSGYYWSSSARDANSGYSLALASSYVSTTWSVNKHNGHSVRCVAK